MGKAVLISIRPEWAEKILGGKKTLEVRKTMPKLETPFKCYVYCTMPNANDPHKLLEIHAPSGKIHRGNGKIVGEFICDDIRHIVAEDLVVREDAEKALKGSGLSPQETKKYAGWLPGSFIAGYKPIYGWHICEVKIYDKPKELGSFKPWSRECKYSDLGLAIPNCHDCHGCKVDRPPQSWCYVEKG